MRGRNLVICVLVFYFDLRLYDVPRNSQLSLNRTSGSSSSASEVLLEERAKSLYLYDTPPSNSAAVSSSSLYESPPPAISVSVEMAKSSESLKWVYFPSYQCPMWPIFYHRFVFSGLRKAVIVWNQNFILLYKNMVEGRISTPNLQSKLKPNPPNWTFHHSFHQGTRQEIPCLKKLSLQCLQTIWI